MQWTRSAHTKLSMKFRVEDGDDYTIISRLICSLTMQQTWKSPTCIGIYVRINVVQLSQERSHVGLEELFSMASQLVTRQVRASERPTSKASFCASRSRPRSCGKPETRPNFSATFGIADGLVPPENNEDLVS